MIRFKNNRSLTAYLVRSQFTDFVKVGRSKSCGGRRSPHLCENMKDICTCKHDWIHKINNKYNCNSKIAIV